MPIICQGCGHRVAIPDGYRRNKIQCSCGVICEVPDSARQEVDAPSPKMMQDIARSKPVVEEQAERWLLDDETPVTEPTEPAGERPADELRFPCRRCGRLLRRQRECPECDRDTRPAVGVEPVWCPSVDEPDDRQGDDEDDSSPYAVTGADDVPCPKCGLLLPSGSVLCIRCGYHLKKRKKIAKSYQPLDRAWETNVGYSRRFTIFASCALGLFVAGLLGVLRYEFSFVVFLFCISLVTAMLAFLLGTFDHLRLTRDSRGRVQLTKTWRFGFFARKPQTIDVRGFEGIASGRHRELGYLEYFVCFVLLASGLLPGIVWWYFVIHQVTFHVSLCRDHGFPAYTVYSGWSEMQMKEIAFALRDATGLRYDEG